MERFFAALSKRQTMMLLTAVTFGGTEAAGSFDHLPPDEAELLKHRANEMLQIPREKRIPLLAQEIKRLVTARRGALWTADPEALAAGLAKERSALIEVVLKALPTSMGEQVRAKLPRRNPVSVKREVKPEILAIVRWKLEELLSRRKGAFKFSDVLILQARELLTVCDRMGARALATSLAGLPDAEREAFLKALPPDQRSLASRAAEAGIARKLPEADARGILELHGALVQPSAGMRSAGAQRLARACLAQSPEFAARVVERHPGDFGRLLQRWMKEERNRPVRGDGGRADILEQVERLAQKGIVDRPLRLPPPPKHPLPPPVGRPSAGPGLPGGKLLPPVLRPVGVAGPRMGGAAEPPGRRPLLGPPTPRRDGGGEPPRRDPMAERAARNAGALSSRPEPDGRRDPLAERVARRAAAVPTGIRGAYPHSEPRAGSAERAAARPERPERRPPSDGPPLRREGAGQNRVLREGAAAGRHKAVTAKGLQAIPRLKTTPGVDPSRPSRGGAGARSPVIKGSNRGPKDGSG